MGIDDRLKSLDKEKREKFKEILTKLDDFQSLLMREWKMDDFAKIRRELLESIMSAIEKESK